MAITKTAEVNLTATVARCRALYDAVANDAQPPKFGELRLKQLAQCVGWMSLVAHNAYGLTQLQRSELSKALDICSTIRREIVSATSEESAEYQCALQVCNRLLDALRREAFCDESIGENDGMVPAGQTVGGIPKVKQPSDHHLGVSFSPACLMIADEHQEMRGTNESLLVHLRKPPKNDHWSGVKIGWREVPKEWLFSFVEKKNLRPFCIVDKPDRIVLPLIPSHDELVKPEDSEYFGLICKEFRRHNKRVRKNLHTPFDAIMNKQGLQIQLQLVRAGRATMVIHNLVGPKPFAAVSQPSLVANTCCFYVFDSDDKAHFVAGLLNSNTFFRKILRPEKVTGRYHMKMKGTEYFPTFNPQNESHRSLVELAQRASQSARDVPWNDGMSDGRHMKMITEELRIQGLLKEIDECALNILDPNIMDE